MHRWTSSLAAAFAIVVAGTAFAADAPPKEGDKAPDIQLQATQADKALPDAKGGKALKLSDLKGKKNVVLFFFPKAMTRGCTIESCGFRDHTDQLAKLDTVVIGISTDALDAQQQFTDKEKLNFPLYADPEAKATKAYGALRPDRPMAQRYTFVIDKQGVVRKVYTTVNPQNHPEEVLKFVKENLAK
jgi:peroxiredoxin Q/BCP